MADELQQFKATYITECLELLSDMEELLMNLDEDSPELEDLNAIFRCAHSIKGGAGAFGFTQIAKFTHILEALLDKMREGKVAATRPVIDSLLAAQDIVLRMVHAARDGEDLPDDLGGNIAAKLAELCDLETSQDQPSKNKESAPVINGAFKITFVPHREIMAHGNDPLLLLRELKRLGECKIEANTDSLPTLDKIDPELCYLSWDITLSTDKGKEAILEVFEFVEDECDLSIVSVNAQEETDSAPKEKTPDNGDGQQDNKKPNKQATLAKKAPISTASASIRVDIDKVDRLINMVGEIVIIQAMLSMQSRFLTSPEHAELSRGVDELTTHTRELQEAVMAVRMQPVKSIFSRMPRLVRDLSGQLGKDIALEMSGETTEVDKTIIEQLSDPLTHMIRNSIDHGLEMPDERVAAGKTAQGTITLSASHRGGKIVIEISDDGNGINRERVLAKAKEKGIVDENAELTDTEIDKLIFAPGFSTAASVTSISGRGVGMDVVRRNIESIGGSVALENTPGKGSLFTISLPLTLAILDGMIVRVAEECYIIPIANIIETLRPKEDDVQTIADGRSVINVRGEFVPVLYLHKIFNIKGAIEDASKGLVVLVETGSEQLGVVVDELVGQQQVVIKTLEENADPIAGVSGATILGDGKVSLILDTTGLLNMKGPHKPSPNSNNIKQAA